jgi:aspartyl-tRNA(Asn)/glutamyl-tRNA(Gln) amidotransferase subunit A
LTIWLARPDDPPEGVPVAIKDLFDTAGLVTTYGSAMFAEHVPRRDAEAVARLRAAGYAVAGKANLHEFAYGISSQNPHFGTVPNPSAPGRLAGGSSGGSAAAVASGMVPAATASDGGGSTRIPASFSGLPGFKPSFGRIPHPPSAASQTTSYGLLATTVADLARHLDVAAGPDDRDRTSLPAPTVDYEAAVEQLDVWGLRATWSPDLGFATVDPEVAGITEAAARVLIEAAGLQLVDRPVQLTDPVRVWLSAGAPDLWMDLEQGMWPDCIDDLDVPVRVGLERTERLTVPWFARTLQRRRRLEEDVAGLFRDVDVLLTPATAVPAFAAEGPMPRVVAGKKVHPAMSVPFTMLANLCWNPAMSLPAGVTVDGLPVGLQVVSRRHADEVVLRLGRLFEQVRPWPRLAPGYG